MAQIEALVHFHFKEEPQDAERLAVLWGRLQFVLEFKGELSYKEVKIG